MENNSETKQRVLSAALCGFAAGTVATLTSSFINTWLFPDLPLYLEWSSILFAWVLWSALGGALAGVAAFSSEGWKSILLSAAGMAGTILIFSSLQSSESVVLKLLAFVGLLFPVSAMMIPLAFVFFWLARRFLQAASVEGWARWKVFIANSIVILALGTIPGLYARMNARTEQSVRIVHSILQEAPIALHKALSKTEGFAEHQGQPYTLSQSPSVYSTVGVDVTAHYSDGYTILCTVVLYPGSDPSIIPCKGLMP